MVFSKTLAVGLLGVLYADAAPQIHGLPRAETTDLPDFEVETEYIPVVKTIFRNRPSSIPSDVKTTSAVLEGTTRAILIPSNVPTSAKDSVAGHDGQGTKTVVSVVQTMTAWLAEPINPKKEKPTAEPTVTKTGGEPWPTITSLKTDASIPVLSGTHSIGMTSLDEQASNIVKSAISTASVPAAPTNANVPQLSTCGFGGNEYTDGDKITSGNSTYTVHCIQDNSQPAYTMQYVSTGGFNACPAACDRTPGCMGFTFFGDDSGFCYLKSAEGQYSMSNNKFITSAFKTTATPGEAGSSNNDSGSRSGSGQSNDDSKSCKGLGKESFESNGKTYTVACDTDLSGHDIGPVQASSFSGCFEECNKKDGCSAFSFLGGGGSGTCYLKSKGVPDTSNFNNADSAYLPNPKEDATSTSQGSQTGAAAPTATSAGSCESLAKDDGPAQFTDKYGSLYNITCKKDIPGGNLKTVVSPTFEECFSQCDENSQCVGFSWLGGYCYLKSSQANSISESPADVAVKVKVGPDVPKATGGGSDGQQHSGTITMVQPSVTSSVPGPSSPAGLSCKQSPQKVGLYNVTCGLDAQGGDLSMKSVDSFSACFPACDLLSQCIGFAYVGGSGSGVCYFKQKHRPEGTNSGVDIAFKPAAGATLPGLTASTVVPTAMSTSGTNGLPFTKTESTKTASNTSAPTSVQTTTEPAVGSFASTSQASEKTSASSSSSSSKNTTSTSQAGSFASTSHTSAKETSSTTHAASFATSSTHTGSFVTSSTHAGSFATTSRAPEKTSSSRKKSSSSRHTGSFVSSPHTPEKTTTSEKTTSKTSHRGSFASSHHAPSKTSHSSEKTSSTTPHGSFATTSQNPEKTSHASEKTSTSEKESSSSTQHGSFVTTTHVPEKTSSSSEKSSSNTSAHSSFATTTTHASDKTSSASEKTSSSTSAHGSFGTTTHAPEKTSSSSEKTSSSTSPHGSFATTTHAPEKTSSSSEKTSSSTSPHGSFATTTHAPEKTSSAPEKTSSESENKSSSTITTQHGSFTTEPNTPEKTSSASEKKSSSSSDHGSFISSSSPQTSEQKSSSSTNGGSFVSTSAKTSATSTSPVWTITGDATTITKTAASAPSTSSHGSFQSSSASKTSSPTTEAQKTTSSAPTSKHSSSVVVEETTVIKHTKTEEPKVTSTSSSIQSPSSSTHSTTLQTVTRVTTSAAATTSSKPSSSSTRTLVNTSSSTRPAIPTNTKGRHIPPVTNPGLPIPHDVDPAGAKKCGSLLRDGDWFKLKTQVVRGPSTLDNHYIQAPSVQSFGGSGVLPTWNDPIPGLLQGAAPRPALCAPNDASGAIFTWAQNDTLAMISDLTTLKDCHQDGLSLLQPPVGDKTGDCSFIPRLASQGATQAEHGGIEYDMGRDGAPFGGWKICHGSQQLQWMIPGAMFDESRCAEVNLLQERVGAEDPSFRKSSPGGS